jgi:hypothetical protein
MWYSVEDIERRASLCASRRGLALEHRLGHGKDGIIFQTSLQTAMKVFVRRDMYDRELACYQRLASFDVETVRGHNVPRLITWDPELLAIEMEIVTRPFLLDFADAWLDAAPDFPPEVLEQWHEEKQEQFGERWPEVLAVMDELRERFGIHLLDVNPGNITFGKDCV